MRLYENSGEFENGKVFIAARHGEDEAELTTELNQPLNQESIHEVQELAEDIRNYYLENSHKFPSGVKVFVSPRLRAQQTAAVLVTTLNQAGVKSQYESAPDIQEIDQGDFTVIKHEHGTEYPPLMNAWAAFIKELKAGNILYNFGDAVELEDGGYKYKELVEFFNIFGEDEANFSVRLYDFLIKLFEEQDDSLNILITHQVIVSRIQKILDSASHIVDKQSFEAGTFVTDLEHKGKRVNVSHAEGVVIQDYNYKAIGEVLIKELDYLNQLIASRDKDLLD